MEVQKVLVILLQVSWPEFCIDYNIKKTTVVAANHLERQKNVVI